MAADTALILVGDNPAALDALVAPFTRRLARAGWSRRSADPFVRVYSPTAARVEVREGGDVDLPISAVPHGRA